MEQSEANSDKFSLLIADLQDSQPHIQQAALERLLMIKDNMDMAAMIAVLAIDPNSFQQGSRTRGQFNKLQEIALEELKKFSSLHAKSQTIKKSVPNLITLLTKHMEEASHALAIIGDPRAIGPMIEAFRNTNMNSVVVARVLSNFKDKRAIEPLLEALVRGSNYAVDMLDKCDKDWPQTEAAKNAIPDLIKALDNDETNELATLALERIGDASAVEPIFDAIKSSTNWRPIGIGTLEKLYPDWATSEMATNSVSELISINSSGSVLLLGEIRDPRAIEPLITGLISTVQEASSFSWNYQDALIKIGTPAVQPLINVLVDDNNDSVYVSGTIAKILGKIGDPQAVRPLISFLEYEDRDHGTPNYLTGEVIEALGKIGDARAIEPLLKELNMGWIFYEVNISLENILRTSLDEVDLDTLVKLAKLEDNYSMHEIDRPKYDWDVHDVHSDVPLPFDKVIAMAGKEIERRRQ